MDNTKNIRVLSLCAGYGGLELGLSRALQKPMRVVAVEVEAYALANLVEKTEKGKMAIEALWPDLKTFPAKEFSGCFDIITAGYPCQPFSTAGKRKGTADPRHLWPFIRDIVEQIRPTLCFFENVAGHLSIGFDSVVRDLDGLGYRVEAGLFTAAEVGAPHRRERLFILADSRHLPRCPEQRQQQKELPEKFCGSDKLGDTTSQRPHRGQEDGCGQQPEVSGQGFEDAGELAQPESKGQQTSEQSRNETTQPRLANGSSTWPWPARPRQDQYEWEEPRTVDNSVCGRHQQQNEKVRTRGNGLVNADKRQVKPRLGRAVNGPSCRVDRLRLLGNGVVPAQADLAFRTLMKGLWE